MHFEISKQELLAAIHRVEGAIPNKTTLPILSNMLVETIDGKVNFSATDLDLSIVFQSIADVIEEGAITIPSRRFAEIIKELPNEKVSINTKNGYNIFINCGLCSFKLNGLPKEEFPLLPEFERSESVVMEQGVFKTMLKKVSFAMSKDETRHILNGTFFLFKNNTLNLAATDSRRIAIIQNTQSFNLKNEKRLIIPTKMIIELSRALQDKGNLEIAFAVNQVAFQLNKTILISRLIEGEFPPYEQAIPNQNYNKMKIDKQLFLSALKRVGLFTSIDSQSVKMDIFKEKLIVSKITPDVGEAKENINIEYGHSEISINVNPFFMIDILKVLDKDVVEFEIEDEKPCVIKEDNAESGKLIYIVLPMTIK
ncbi:MAG: DNA polymerase III subunit beta [Candidatus Omnitrophota bacterium]|nr:MAG: DNA polymerase III subunit beta [Candidatus Omnitrophota bacterium]